MLDFDFWNLFLLKSYNKSAETDVMANDDIVLLKLNTYGVKTVCWAPEMHNLTLSFETSRLIYSKLRVYEA